MNQKSGREDMAPASGGSAALLRRLLRELMKTVFLLAALVAVAFGTIAWFASNTRVRSTSASVTAQHRILRLATMGDRQSAEKDYLKIQIDQPQPDGSVQSTEETLPDGEVHRYGEHNYYYTENGTIALRLNGDDTSISPGAHGEVTFYIIPTEDGPIEVSLSLSLAGYRLEGNDIETPKKAVRVADAPMSALLSGHILLFQRYDSATRRYSGWLGNSDSQENRIAISIPNAHEGVPEPVTFYWIWPLRYESMADSLFVKGSKEYANTFAPWLRQQAVISEMEKYPNVESYYYSRIFLTNQKTEDLSKPYFTNDAYNRADEYIGTHADYLYLSIQTA